MDNIQHFQNVAVLAQQQYPLIRESCYFILKAVVINSNLILAVWYEVV